ncbi:MAG: ribulose-phosphate 3-epimerase [Candidatus Omnitrophica bacterium]|nr:ribulose-phosphate 3-epimerase [Candidatus Omnitrophota bacterium]
MEVIVSTSILSADFGKLAEAVELCERSGVDRIHVDVMDGHFVPNITIGPVVTAAVRKYTKLPIAAHLMIENPGDYIDAFIDAGADLVGVHVECYGERRVACRAYGQYPKEIDVLDVPALVKDLRRIRARGKQACVTINPGTPVECLAQVLNEVDAVLIMSVNPGFSGQKFMPSALTKIMWLRAQGFKRDIAVDGGVNAETAPAVVKAGANVLITASYFFSSQDHRGVVEALKRLGS